MARPRKPKRPPRRESLRRMVDQVQRLEELVVPEPRTVRPA